MAERVVKEVLMEFFEIHHLDNVTLETRIAPAARLQGGGVM